MAKIPAFQSNQQLDARPRVGQVAQPNTSSAKALSELGKTIVGVGGQALQIEEKRRWANVTTFADIEGRNMEMDIKMALDQEKRQSQGTNFEGYQERVSKVIDTKLQEYSAKSKDIETVNYFQNRNRAKAEIWKKDALSTQRVEAAKFAVNAMEEMDDKDASYFHRNPNPVEAAERLGEIESQRMLQKDVLLSPQKVQESMDKAAKKFRNAVVQGLDGEGLLRLIPLNQPQEEKEKFIDNFLDGKIAGTERLMGGMTVEDRITLSTRLKNALIREENVQIREITSEARNAISILNSNDYMDGKSESYIQGVRARLNTLPAGPERDDIAASLDGAAQARTMLFNTRSGGPAAIVDLLNNADALFPVNPETASRDLAARAHFVTAVSREVKESREDPAAYTQKNWPETRGNIEKTIAKQSAMGIPVAVYSKAEATVRAGAIMEGINPADRAIGFSEVLSQVPRQYHQKAVAELMKADSRIGMEYLVAASTDDIALQKTLISNGAQREAIETSFSRVPAGKESLRGEMTKNSTIMGMQSALGRMGQHRMAELIAKQVETEAMRTGLSGNIKNAVDTAAKRIIGDTYHSIDAPNAKIVAPKYAVSEPVLNGFLQVANDPDVLQRMGASKSRHMFNDTDENWYKYLKENSFWVTNENLDGLVLVREVGGTLPPVVDTDGKPISIGFEDLEKRTDPKINAAMVEQSKNSGLRGLQLSLEQRKKTQRELDRYKVFNLPMKKAKNE